MRPQRTYEPFGVKLLEARHDVYAGTDIAKNFSSRVELLRPDGTSQREVLIYMNNPLRYAGLTFYQYQMNAGQHESVLQVVRNPSWRLPYIACTMMAAGLVLQFGAHLLSFVKKRRAAVPAIA
jgi:cytochrome c biogenesis protein ResB